ncbi:hypothetical protein L202_01457 [Cryptococcus amylolentus CBS 6039]|uniref:Cupin 2 conserved barrel domain-containing protein n=1 Tax=Cryptococcus amylolentus CBS 6039 TaxID=1295533 RepID=A0A1E3I621_9TREE|nr:hypothetical protein L202_01457 [Cryptococcus amylolentus CBS 6039]ODN83286.1 hypothetical protein L202_01457 [Cryptococcus amylolentus CBS 6039]
MSDRDLEGLRKKLTERIERDGMKGMAVSEEHHFPSADTDTATLKAQVLFLQPDLVTKPEKAVEWAEARPDKISHDDAISVRYVVNLPPSADVFFHFTQTIGYPVITHDKLEMELHDGTKTIVHPGDLVVQAAIIHRWNNLEPEWARAFASLNQCRC